MFFFVQISVTDEGALQKSGIRETKHLSTEADSSTNTTVGWTKNTQPPSLFGKKGKKSFELQKM